ncbi:hypothetical protein CU666_19560 [Pseudomonas syringae pv. actinidifoliorum]|nr:hypothetical protein [Pseudomonas syringae pv. actinidifoliorum]NAT60134.1 hypothetical protein [Pseudomonas syringae pv. actinidifoliorum]
MRIGSTMPINLVQREVRRPLLAGVREKTERKTVDSTVALRRLCLGWCDDSVRTSNARGLPHLPRMGVWQGTLRGYLLAAMQIAGHAWCVGVDDLCICWLGQC